MIRNNLYLTKSFEDLTQDLTDDQLGQLIAGLVRRHYRGKAFETEDPMVQKVFDRVNAEAIHIG